MNRVQTIPRVQSVPTPQEIGRYLRQPSDPQVKVWRYLSLSRFVWLLSKKQLWMSRIDRLGDKFEAVVPGAVFASAMPGIPEWSDAPEAAEQRIAALQTLRRQMFVSCWHLSEHESHGMWQAYCRSGDGVCIRTTYRKLRASVAFLPTGLVEYIDVQTYNGKYNPWLGAWLKRDVFSFENEVRILSLGSWVPGWLEMTPSERLKMTYPIGWDPEQIVEGVYVHPESDFSYIESVNDIVDRFAPALSGKVWYSSMGVSPPY
jgi:hypothetical protein